jgi:hypothetical protein
MIPEVHRPYQGQEMDSITCKPPNKDAICLYKQKKGGMARVFLK